MRIAILSAFYPLRGGIAQFSACLYRGLEAKHDVKAFTFKRQYPDFLFPGETQYVTGADNADPIPSEQVLDSINPLSFRKTARAINAYNPDLLIINHWMSFFGPSFGRVAGLVKDETHVLSILHNVVPHESRFFDKPFTKYFLKRSNSFVVLSDAVREELDGFGVSQKSLTLSHPYYNHFGKLLPQENAQLQLKLLPNKKTLLFFGFIRKYKGLDLLLRAFDKLDESYQLIIAGECYGDFSVYQSMIDTNSNTARIHVINRYISDEEVPVLFSASDVCMLPYKSATQSGIANIAMHFELPIIATNVGGISEMIDERANGIIVKEPTAEHLQAAILRFFDNDLGRIFKTQMPALKLTNSWSSFCTKLIEFYANL